MKNLSPPVTRRSVLHSVSIMLATLGLFVGCVSTPAHPDWMRIGVTTKADVLARYGQPDLLIGSPDGDTVVYRPSASVPRLEIPTAQAGPFGTSTTSMQRINPGLDTNDLNRERKELLRSEIRVRYDNRGVVQELSSP
jgi:hypothetical protein